MFIPAACFFPPTLTMDTLLSYVQALETQTTATRLQLICHWLDFMGVPYHLHRYGSGTNLLIPPTQHPYVGISGHFDVAPGCAGANDNASGVAVILGLLAALAEEAPEALGVAVMLFDEEEDGQIGSQAYVRDHSLRDLLGLINLEMVGYGEHLALWPVAPNQPVPLAHTLERICRQRHLLVRRFDRIWLHSAAHARFQAAGLVDSFSLTCISDEDLQVAEHYYKAMEFDVDLPTLRDIFVRAPLFRHYHQASDRSEHLSEATLQRTRDLLLQTLFQFEQHLVPPERNS